MVRILFGVVIVLHGLVHLLYFGQSARFYELQPGMVWPDGSWVFSKLLGDAATRSTANVLLILAAVGFVTGGAGMFLNQAWWQPVVVSAAVLSSVVYILLWDGRFQGLDNKGGLGILINLAILVSLLVFRWPE